MTNQPLPKMKFEEIIERFKSKKLKPSSQTPKKLPDPKLMLMECSKCGEKFEVKIYGPRHVRGACPCGGTTVMG